MQLSFTLALIISFGIGPSARADSSLTCVSDRTGLNSLMSKALANRPFVENWIETTANDGKPLKIIMSTRNEKLYFVFDKTREGIWAEGAVDVCRGKTPDASDPFLVKLGSENIILGANAPTLVRWSMSGGATFKLRFKDASNMHVSTTGWSGDFVPEVPSAASAPKPAPAQASSLPMKK